MNILGFLDLRRAGNTFWKASAVRTDPDELAEIRNRKIGFIFQGLTFWQNLRLENVELPLVYATSFRKKKDLLRRRSRPWASKGGSITIPVSFQEASSRGRHWAALVNEPSILLADEPTGNLDSRTSEEIMGIFQRFNENLGITIIMITHEPDIARYAKRNILFRTEGSSKIVETVRGRSFQKERRQHETFLASLRIALRPSW